jgi:hypothetical protein
VFIPEASILLDPSAIFPGPAATSVVVNTPLVGFNASTSFNDGDQVVFSATAFPAGTPVNIDGVTQYYVVNKLATSFQVSQTLSGPPIILTSPGASVKARSALDDTFTYINHGFSNGDVVALVTTGTLPGGLIPGQVYYIIRTTPNTFKLSATQGGAPVDILTSGTGVLTVTDLNSVPVGAPVVGSQVLFAEANFPLMVKLSSVSTSFTITLQT